MLERPSTGVTRIPKEKNQNIFQGCYSHGTKKPLRSGSLIKVTEISFVLSLIHTRVSGVLQMPLHVLPSQGVTFVPGPVRGIHREHEWESSLWWWDCFCWWNWKAGRDNGNPSYTSTQSNSPQILQTIAMLRLRVVKAQHTERQTTWKSHMVARMWVRSLRTRFSRNHSPLVTCPVKEKEGFFESRASPRC